MISGMFSTCTAYSKLATTFAAILSCADSRVAPEYCFDTARGDLFVCRIAGNFASDDADEWHDFAQMNIARF
jgi:carbonic anhydrase